MITFGFQKKGSSIIRAVTALCLGTILLCFPDKALTIIVKTLAAFLIASGIATFIYGLITKKEGGLSLMMVNAIVDAVLGIMVFICAGFVSKFIFFLIGVLLVGFGIMQLLSLSSAVKYADMGAMPFILPAVAVVGGAFLLFNPFSVKIMCILAGLALLVYGVSELMASRKMAGAIREYEIRFPDGKPAQKEGNAPMDIVDVEYEKVDEQ